MNEIKIITELCAEDRKRIDTLTEGLVVLTGLLSQMQKGPAYKVAEPDPIADLPEEVKAPEVPAEEHPVADESPFPEVPAEPEPQKDEPEVPQVTKDDVRKLFVKLASSGKKDQARDIVKAYAASITDLSEDAVSQVYLKLVGLEG